MLKHFIDQLILDHGTTLSTTKTNSTNYDMPSTTSTTIARTALRQQIISLKRLKAAQPHIREVRPIEVIKVTVYLARQKSASF